MVFAILCHVSCNAKRTYFLHSKCTLLLILCFRSHVYITYRGDYREQTVSESDSWQWNRCTNPVIAVKTGLELCAELSLPNKDMSLSLPRGAAVARVYLNKRDTYTGVHFDASYIQSEVRAVVPSSSTHLLCCNGKIWVIVYVFCIPYCLALKANFEIELVFWF